VISEEEVLDGGDLLLKGGRVFIDDGLAPADVLVREGCITQIGRDLTAGSLPVLQLDGLTVLPGVVDSQVHFREPGLEHKEDLASGSRAALAGGVTSFLEMPNTRPPTVSAEALEDKLRRARGRSWCDHAFFVGASVENAEDLGELERLPGCAGVKIFMGSSTGSLLVAEDADLRRVLRSGSRRAAVHAEDEERLRALREAHPEAAHPSWHPRLRDEESAARAVTRLLDLSAETGRPVHVLHVGSAREMKLLAPLRAEPRVTVEVTPQHLLLEAPACYEELGSLAQMNPPIREAGHRRALWQGLHSGLVACLGSDHAPHTLAEKEKEYPASPSGMPGVETMLPLMLDQVRHGSLGLGQLVRLLCSAPAEIYRIRRKGRIAVGCDGDFAVVDLNRKWTPRGRELRSRAGWTPFEGRELQGRVVYTILRGNVCYRRGEFLGRPAGRALEFDLD